LPGFGTELKSHFRSDLLQFGYNDAFSPEPWTDVIGQFYCALTKADQRRFHSA